MIVSLVFVALAGCSKSEKNYTIKEVDGVKVIHNKNIPSVKDLKFDVKELFTIEADEAGFQNLREMCLDDLGNMYLVCSKTCKVYNKFINLILLNINT